MTIVNRTSITIGNIGFGSDVVSAEVNTIANQLRDYAREGNVRVNVDDETVGLLDDKLLVGSGLTKTVSANNQTITLAFSGSAGDELVGVTANDTTPGYLDGKLKVGANLIRSIANANADAEMTINLAASVTDKKLKVSTDDTTPGYLDGKLTAGSNITLTVNNDGADETLTIAASGGSDELVAVSANDTTPDYLRDKLTSESAPLLEFFTVNPGGNEVWRAHMMLPDVNGFRLGANQSVEGASAYTDPSDSSSGATLYYRPWQHSYISLPTGVGTGDDKFWEVAGGGGSSVDVSGLSDGNYDLFARWNGTSLVLETVAWTNDTTRAATFFNTDHNRLLSLAGGSNTNLYVGTFRVESGTVSDTPSKRHIWNRFNRLPRTIRVEGPASPTSWTYATVSWRPWNNDATASTGSIVVGLVEDMMAFDVYGSATNNFGRIGVGINSTSANGAMASWGDNGRMMPARWQGVAPRLGYSEFTLLELADAGGSNVTFHAHKPADDKQNLGGIGWMMA